MSHDVYMCVCAPKKNTALEECKASLTDTERRAQTKALQDAKVCRYSSSRLHPVNYISQVVILKLLCVS